MSRSRAKRILGMTIPQWGVLGVLFLLIVCILAGGFWWLNSMVARAYESPVLPTLAVTPRSTSTTVVTAVVTSSPTPTPISYESLIPTGWRRFTPSAAPGLQIWLPSSYDAQNEKMKQATTPIYDAEGARPIMALWDSTPSPYMIFTTFEVVSRPASLNDLDKMFDDQFGDLIGAGRLLERDDFEFIAEEYAARRAIIDITINGVNAGLAIYTVHVRGDVYYLGFATAFNELYAQLPVYDQIMQTFRIVPVVPTPAPSLTPAPPTNTPKP